MSHSMITSKLLGRRFVALLHATQIRYSSVHLKPVRCWIDVKSPHAYLLLGPALQLQKDYAVEVQFLPYTLDFVSQMGLTVTLDEKGIRVPPSAHADRRARMFYTTAREYAKLQGLRIRGPTKLLDSRVGNLGLLYASQLGDWAKASAYLALLWGRGWPSGWRDFDLEDPQCIEDTLTETMSVPAGDFRDYIAPDGRGDQYMSRIRSEAEDVGLVGVPHLAMTLKESEQILGLYGREHLSLLRLYLHEEGLARRTDVTPHVSHAWIPGENL